MQPYMEYPIGFIKNLALWQMLALVAGALALAAFAWGASRLAAVRRIEPWLPPAITVVVLVLAVYAYFFRTESGPGRVALHDAIALRSFAWYITPIGLAAAFAGYVLAMQTTFRRDPVLLATVTIFGLFFFYKIKIVPVHFWMARRFLPVILPGAMLLIGYAAFCWLQSKSTPREGAKNGDRAKARAVAARGRRDRRHLRRDARLPVLARVAAAAGARRIRRPHPEARSAREEFRRSRSRRRRIARRPARSCTCSRCRSPTSTRATSSC